MSNNNLNIFCILAGVAGVGYAIYTSNKMNKLCNKLDKAVDDVAEDINIDISDDIVNQAVERVVNREAHIAVNKAVNDSVKAIKSDMHAQIKAAVDLEFVNIEKAVADKISKEVASIDMKKLSDDIKTKAEEKIIEKFDDNLDGLLNKFNGELDSVARIYKSIAEAMSHNKREETILRIS